MVPSVSFFLSFFLPTCAKDRGRELKTHRSQDWLMPTRYQTRHQTLQSCHVGFVFISCQSIQEPSGLNSLPQSFTCTRRLQMDNDIIKDVPILSSGGRRSWLLSSLRVSKKTKCCRPWLIGKKVRKQKITKSGTALFVGKKVVGGNSAGVCVGLCGWAVVTGKLLGLATWLVELGNLVRLVSDLTSVILSAYVAWDDVAQLGLIIDPLSWKSWQ